MSDLESLPRFEKPPVVETVLGVHFRPLETLTSAHQGLVWERLFRPQFPNLEDRAPIAEARERFGEERLAGTPVVRWQVQDRPEAPRLWAASESGEHVVQIQKDAFFANWLRPPHYGAYLPYAERRREFSEQLAKLDEFVRQEGLGQIEPTACVVTYVNHIELGGFEEIGPTLARLLTCWTNETSDDWLPNPDNAIVKLGFPMPEQAGRLNVTLTPVVQRDSKRHMLRLDLTARRTVNPPEIARALEEIHLGHEWVVRGFASLTRPEMHTIWERER